MKFLSAKCYERYQQRHTNWIHFDIEALFIEVRDKRTDNIPSQKLWNLLDLKALIHPPLRNGGKFEFKDSNQTKIDHNFYLRINPAMILTELIATKLRNLETKVSLQDFLSELSIFVLEMSLYMFFLKGF